MEHIRLKRGEKGAPNQKQGAEGGGREDNWEPLFPMPARKHARVEEGRLIV